jgi:hypothetical protein
MFKKILVLNIVLSALFLGGCASVPTATIEKDTAAKTFTVRPGKANIYVYRNESFGGAVKMTLVLDDRVVGDTASKTFALLEVNPGKHILVSKGETDSTLTLNTVAGKNYFVWQEVKMGLMSARSALQLVNDATGRAGVAECKLIEKAK